jgi:hypothetical protein
MKPTKPNKTRLKRLIRKQAEALAEGLFYCDAECKIIWAPFADYTDSWVSEQCKQTADFIEQGMRDLITQLGE